MSKIITLRKGLDINLVGKPQESLADAPQASEYALSPLDFEGVTPKLLVKEGDRVKAGTPLFFNKYNERVLFTSPVSGTVAAVNRGEKRKVLSVTVTPDASQEYEEFEKTDLGSASREQIVSLLLRSGLWPMIVQRPYGIIADPSDTPKAVFISAFDSAPLAPDYNFVLKAEQKNLQTGIDVMRKLTPGKVHLSVRAKAEGQMPSLKGAELHAFAGKHPVGNVGVQIHHIDPVNKGEVVWTVNVQDLATIGRFFSTGKVDRSKVIAVTGSEVAQPQYCRIIDGEIYVLGMHISPYEKGNIFNKDPLRPRKLLVHRYEINKIVGKIDQKGYTLVPLQIYFKGSLVKVEFALAKGKKLYDKRADIAKKDTRREAEREFKVSNLY